MRYIAARLTSAWLRLEPSVQRLLQTAGIPRHGP